MKIIGIILSGGSGNRMGTDLPKQFLELDGESLLVHSVKVFKQSKRFDQLVTVANPEHLERTKELILPWTDAKDILVEGGRARHDSFLNALKALQLEEDDIILIHDAARPFITLKEIQGVIAATMNSGVATLAEKVTETIVMVEENKVKQIRDRDRKFLIKTPQGIRGKELKKLLLLDHKTEPTDLCSWAILGGMETEIVESNPYNLKITQPEDLEKAQVLLPLFKKIDHNPAD